MKCFQLFPKSIKISSWRYIFLQLPVGKEFLVMFFDKNSPYKFIMMGDIWFLDKWFYKLFPWLSPGCAAGIWIKNNGSLSSRAPDNFTKFWAMHFRVYFIIQHKQLNTRKCLSPNLLQIKMYVQFCYFNVMVFTYNALLTNSRYRPSTFLMKKRRGWGQKT